MLTLKLPVNGYPAPSASPSSYPEFQMHSAPAPGTLLPTRVTSLLLTYAQQTPSREEGKTRDGGRRSRCRRELHRPDRPPPARALRVEVLLPLSGRPSVENSS